MLLITELNPSPISQSHIQVIHRFEQKKTLQICEKGDINETYYVFYWKMTVLNAICDHIFFYSIYSFSSIHLWQYITVFIRGTYNTK